VVAKPHPDDGPVLITIEYRINPDHAQEFADAMQAVRQERLRDGAFRAGLFRDPSEPGRYLETFVVESWAEHLRQHQRVTVSDRADEERARAFHIGEDPPTMSHFIAAHTQGVPDGGAAERQ
jgi:quinol monooxygenase YgiN